MTKRGEQSLAAVWSDKGQVEIIDLQSQLEAVHSPAAMAAFIKQQKEATPLFSFAGHMGEGFAIDWSPTVPGKCLLLHARQFAEAFILGLFTHYYLCPIHVKVYLTAPNIE